MKLKLIIFIGCISLFAACSGDQKPVDLTTSATASTKKHADIGTINERSLSGSARLPGQLKPFNEVNTFLK